MADIVKTFKESLPEYIKTLPERNKPSIWLPQKYALAYERFKIYQNDRHFMMVDYDHESGTPPDHRHYDIEPNIIIYNPHNHNHQAYWRIADPVYCQETARANKPYLYLRAIEAAYDEKYAGDIRFARYISRNPLYMGVFTDWRHNKPYKLQELAEVVDLNQKRIKSGNREITRQGRNCTVFDHLRLWAYKQDTNGMKYNEWIQRCITQAVNYNDFKNPMGLREVHSIAKSVAQYTFNRHFSETKAEYVARTHTSEIQAVRGRKSAEKRWKDHVKQTPWVDMGISRATYYRRKKAGKL